MFELLQSIRKRDPAQPTFAEVLFAYNGYHAVCLYRMNHWIWGLGLRALARFCANITRILTGVEIHPQAQIGKNLFIDHGTGVVIGQTALIGDEVTIYHGVTLGGVGVEGQVSAKRHPTIGDGAIIGSGAQVLGDIVIGARAKIGSNSVVTSDIPEGCTAVGVPARIIKCAETARAYGMPTTAELAENFQI
jgi:serine O-acetyltransferase